jgi:HAMP domain-containing protein/HPt (histidine-containing phosphotransfer) domain-containing protein
MGSLRDKFGRILLFVAVVIGISTLGCVVFLNVQASRVELALVEKHIQDGLSSRGHLLTRNHALALRGLVLDNAFFDMQRLVEQTVRDEKDLVYGIFVNSEREARAIYARGDKALAEPPEPIAWQRLGLREEELLVAAPIVQRRLRLGQDLLEVAVPVKSEEGEPLGTIRYGLSLERMHDALASAQKDSRARLLRTVIWIGALVATMSLLGFLFSRWQAARVTEPVEELTRAAEALASGDRGVRVDIRSGDELEMLGASFNRMVDELDGSYRALEALNHTLEEKVATRTAELALKNRDMGLVLDNVDHGFITLSPAGIMLGSSSRLVHEWFGSTTGSTPFWDYIDAKSRSFAMALRLAWSQMQDGALPLEACLAQLPARLTNAGRTWSFRYLPFFQGSELEGVLLVVADVTKDLAYEREEAEQAELVEAFRKLMLDRSGFASFVREAGAMVEFITSQHRRADRCALKRTLHTLKGSSGMMGLGVIARLCHTLEDQLAEHDNMEESTLGDLASRWTAIGDHVARFVGVSGQRTVEIPETEYTGLVMRLSRNEPQKDVLHQVLSWQLEPASRSMQRLADQATALSRRLGKGEIETEVVGDNVRLDPNVWGPFFGDLGHVVRNAVDHGFESVEERRTTGKNLRHTLRLRADISNGALTFEVTDDGRGIDWPSIGASADACGLPHATQAELVDALCSDGVTTRRDISDISGRGVGMAAFRRRVEVMNGRLEVHSAPGAGTSFFVRFPWPLGDASGISIPRPSSMPPAGPVPYTKNTDQVDVG